MQTVAAKSSHIRFKPWIGDYYGKPQGVFGGKRVLVLGESHYGSNDYPRLTIDCVEGQASGEESYAFWTKIVRAFYNQNAGQKEKSEFWHSVAFANLVQEIVGGRARVRPTAEMWASGLIAFPELLACLRPQVVVGLGQDVWHYLTVWRHLTKSGKAGPRLRKAPKDMRETWLCPYKGGRALVYYVPHPAGPGLRYKDWDGCLPSALDQI